jgi:hypothetical protein
VTHRALGSLRSGLLKRRVRDEREVQDRAPNAVDFRSAWWAQTEEHIALGLTLVGILRSA